MKEKAEVKHIFVEKEVWKRIHELKYEWDMESVSAVIKELLRRLNLWKN